MRFRHSFWTVALVAIMLGLAACSERSTIGPTPTDRFDVATFEANLATMERVASTPVLESFKALGQHAGSVSVGGSPAAAAGTEPTAVAGRLLRLVSRIATLTGRSSGAQLVPIIRSEVLGSTFVYDPLSKQYVYDPARTGAPPNGVRFILYQLDEETQAPHAEVEIGWVDLIDEKVSSTSSLGLRLRVVSGGVTYLEYGFELSGQLVSPTLAVSGFMSDGTERLTFDLTVSGQVIGHGGAVRLDARLEMPSRGFKVLAAVRGAGGEGQVDLTVQGGDDLINMKASVQESRLDATFTVNGRLLATAMGDPEHPVIRGEGGRDLTPEELAALAQIVGLAEGLFELFGELLEPVGALLGFGVAL